MGLYLGNDRLNIWRGYFYLAAGGLLLCHRTVLILYGVCAPLPLSSLSLTTNCPSVLPFVPPKRHSRERGRPQDRTRRVPTVGAAVREDRCGGGAGGLPAPRSFCRCRENVVKRS